MKRFQFVWWGFREMWFGFWRPDAGSGYTAIYQWSLNLGPLEIRKWA